MVWRERRRTCDCCLEVSMYTILAVIMRVWSWEFDFETFGNARGNTSNCSVAVSSSQSCACYLRVVWCRSDLRSPRNAEQILCGNWRLVTRAWHVADLTRLANLCGLWICVRRFSWKVRIRLEWWRQKIQCREPRKDGNQTVVGIHLCECVQTRSTNVTGIGCLTLW